MYLGNFDIIIYNVFLKYYISNAPHKRQFELKSKTLLLQNVDCQHLLFIKIRGNQLFIIFDLVGFISNVIKN